MKRIFFGILLGLMTVSLAFGATYKVDKGSSKLEWVGEKVTGKHNGFLKLKEGAFEVEDDKLVGGSITVDMTSMTVADLTGEWAEKLLNHLKSKDFFSTNKFKTAKFEIKSVSKLPGGEYLLKGDLTIKGNTHPAEANVKVMLKEGMMSGKGTLKFDRTKWEIKYNSGKFFESLGDKMIHDEVTVNLNIEAKM